MRTSTLTSKGQVTIPVELRKLLGLEPGDHIEFKREGDRVIITKQRENIADAFGLVKVKKKVSLEMIQKAIKQGPLDDID